MQKRKIINGYTVELDTDMNGDGETSGCWISRAGFSASLACMDATGVLERDDGSTFPVPMAAREKIREWAEKNGY